MKIFVFVILLFGAPNLYGQQARDSVIYIEPVKSKFSLMPSPNSGYPESGPSIIVANLGEYSFLPDSLSEPAPLYHGNPPIRLYKYRTNRIRYLYNILYKKMIYSRVDEGILSLSSKIDNLPCSLLLEVNSQCYKNIKEAISKEIITELSKKYILTPRN